MPDSDPSARSASPDSRPTREVQKSKQKLNTYPFWSPRFWHGMRFGDWWGLVVRNRFRIHPLRIPMAVIITLMAPFHSVLSWIQNLRYGRRIRETQLEHDPIFIIGHWRSGTTYLHELMVRDDRFGFPTTYECFCPHHCLVSSWILPKLFWWILPSKRPMDNMAVGFERPQEDEFALCCMGAPTPMLKTAFPNDPPPYLEFLNMEGVEERDLERWKTSLMYIVKTLTLHKGKQLILKSPPHTGRIEILAEMFPRAKFIHISRDPLSVFPSTQRLWRALDEAQGFQLPRHEHLDEFVFTAFERMYSGFEKQRANVAPERIYDIRYEDLVQDPVEEVRRIYETMELGDFESMRPQLEAFLATQRDYKANRHDLDPEIVAEIQRRWAGYIERYGYADSFASATPSQADPSTR